MSKHGLAEVFGLRDFFQFTLRVDLQTEKNEQFYVFFAKFLSAQRIHINNNNNLIYIAPYGRNFRSLAANRICVQREPG